MHRSDKCQVRTGERGIYKGASMEFICNISFLKRKQISQNAKSDKARW